jgi:hypothetical protein
VYHTCGLYASNTSPDKGIFWIGRRDWVGIGQGSGADVRRLSLLYEGGMTEHYLGLHGW